MPKFSIIIVNYNSGIFLVELIDSFRSLNIAPDDFEFIIIDNASTDDSLTKVNWGTLQKKIIVNKQNVGFSRANNQGISLSQGRYVVLLNPDTKLLNNIFTIMENVLKEDRKIGICGPRIYYPDGRLQQSCFSFPSVTRKILAIIGLVDFIERNNFLLALLRRLRIIVPNSARVFETNFDNNFHASIDVPSISGACMMMEKGFLDKVGLLDENIFAYAEDEDLCLRARKLGYKIYYVPRANIVHQSGWKRSSGKTREVVDCKFKSSEYFYKKHYRGLKKYTLILLNKIDWGICRRKSVNSYFNMPCPICKRNSKPKFIEHYQIYKIYGCPLCKGQFSYPLDIDSSIYNELYSKDSTNDISYNSFISLPPERIVGLYKKCPTIKLALKLIKNPESNQKLLDIGCSQGAFCKLTEDLGFEVYGIDPSQDAVNYASSKLGIKNVIAGDFKDIPGNWKDFDIITLFENRIREYPDQWYNFVEI